MTEISFELNKKPSLIEAGELKRGDWFMYEDARDPYIVSSLELRTDKHTPDYIDYIEIFDVLFKTYYPLHKKTKVIKVQKVQIELMI